MDVIASFKAALLMARRAELELRAPALTELDDLTALKKFQKDLDGTLTRLRGEGKIGEDPLKEFLSQCCRVLRWQYRLVEQERAFADRVKQASEAIDELIARGLPEEEWGALQADIAGLEDEFKASQAEWQASRPDELWMVAEGDGAAEAREQLDDLMQHAWNAGLLTAEVGWDAEWDLENPPGQSANPAADQSDIEVKCEQCGETSRFSFGMAGKDTECPECFADLTVPSAAKVTAERVERARALQAERIVAEGEQERHAGLPGGWRDHFDNTPEARERLAARPRYDQAALDELRAKVAATEERKEIWQKYFPRIAATGLPFRCRVAWDLVVQDPAEVVSRLTEEWPESDWALSPKVSALFAAGDMGFGEGVALLATDKADLEKQTRDEIRERLKSLPPILSSTDYRWHCAEADRVKLVYTKLLERKCPGYSWMKSFEVKEEITDAFAAGVEVAEGFDLLLTGKSNKQQLTEADVEQLFDRIRRVKGIAADLYCHDGSKLVDSRELPGDWRFRYWDAAAFESGDWVVANPLVAVRLLSSELPQIVFDYTGRGQLLEWRSRALELLNDESLSPARKAMLLPVMLGLSNEVLFIPEQRDESAEGIEPGRRPGTLRAEVEKNFRSAEVRQMLADGFADKLALYCEQHWLLEIVASEADTRRKGVNYAKYAAIAVVVIGALWFGVTFALKKVEEARNAKANAEAAAQAAMVLKYEIYRENIPTNITAEELILTVDGRKVKSGAQLEEGPHLVRLDHPAFKTFEKNVVMSPGKGVDLGTIRLEPAVGSLSIETDPPGATVSIAGKELGRTPLKVPSIQSGRAAIAITLAGYGTWKTNALIGKDQALAIQYRFGRGAVQFKTTPPGFFVSSGPQSGGMDGLEWKGLATPRTPQQQEFLPGEYTAAFVHPTMGVHEVESFTLADKDQLTIEHQFKVARAAIAGLPAGAKLWRGNRTMGEWVEFDPAWPFETGPALTLLRFAREGYMPGVYPLQASGNSFSSPAPAALVKGGSVECWGSDAKGQSTVPPEVAGRTFIDVAAGKLHTVGLIDDGTVVCWGDNTYGQCGVPEGLGKCVMIGAGDYHTVALQSDGTVVAWGATPAGRLHVPKDLGKCVAVHAAGGRVAAIRSDGGITGWGYGEYQLPPRSRWRPYVELSIGAYYITALDDAGAPAVFVHTTAGIGSPSAEATAAEAEGPFIDVAGGTTASLWLRPDGRLVSVSRDPRAPKVPNALGPFRAVSGEYTRVAAIDRNGTAYIWGRKTGMSTRSGFERQTDEETRVQYWVRKGNFLKIECGENHYVAIRR